MYILLLHFQNYAPASFSDGLLEVVGITGVMQMVSVSLYTRLYLNYTNIQCTLYTCKIHKFLQKICKYFMTNRHLIVDQSDHYTYDL